MTQEEVPLPSHRYATCCRLCLSGDELSCALFPTHPEGTTQRHGLIEMILECTTIQITLEEDYPAKVCKKCVETVDKFYQYRRRCLANDRALRHERQRAAEGQRKSNNNNENEGKTSSPAPPPPPPSPLPTVHHRSPGNGESSHQQHRHLLQRASSSPPGPSVTVVPAIRIKSEPQPLDQGRRVSLEEEEKEEKKEVVVRQDEEPYRSAGEQQHDAASTADGGGMSSILRSILLQTRDSTTSRSSPNTEPESPRQTPQLLPIHPPGTFPGNGEDQPTDREEEEEKDVKPSLLQQMLLQQQCTTTTSPANRSPVKLGDTGTTGGGHDVPLAGPTIGNSSTTATSSSLLKRMLLDGGGTTTMIGHVGQELTAAPQPPASSVSPLEGTSCQQPRTHHRTKHEPPSATNTPSPPASVHRAKDDVPSGETPLASQLRSILLQHRATGWARTASMSDVSPELPPNQTHAGSDADQKPNIEKPEVSYVRSLFLRNDSDSESEPPPVDDQREMLLYAMFHELRARQQQQQQQHQQQQSQSGLSTDSDDDSDDLPQDYRMPSVRRRSTDSVESRSKRRRMEYPCLLCGRTFAGRTKLILHMRTHMMLDGATDGSSPGTAAPGLNAIPSTGTTPPNHTSLMAGVLLPNGGGAGSDVDDVGAGRIVAATARHDEPFGDSMVGTEDEIDALERRSYACYICGADQNNLHQLKEHLLAAHQDRIRSRGRTRERQKASIACEICQRQFRSQFAYGEHMRTHTGERPFPCDQCDKRFPRRFQLLGHLYNVHKQSWVADESKAKFAKK